MHDSGEQHHRGKRESYPGTRFPHQIRACSARNPAVGEHSEHQRGPCDHPKRDRSEDRHLILRVVKFVAEVRRQPGNDEIPDIVSTEKAEKTSPRRALRTNLRQARHLADLFADQRLVFGSPDEPRHQPQQAQRARDVEENAPSVSAHHQAADQNAERRTDLATRVNRRVGKAALLFLEVACQNLRIRRIGDRLAHT